MRDWLSHRVVSSPDETAMIRAEDGEAWTYAELDRLVAETAGRLYAHGIGPGSHLGVLMPPCVGTVGLVHAAMRLGATFVPLGPRLTPRELSARIDSADLSALVCCAETEADAVAAVADDTRIDQSVGEQTQNSVDLASASKAVPVLSVDEPVHSNVEGVHASDPEPIEQPRWEDEDRLCLLFTSGTTGRPKPVPLTLQNVYASAVASAFRLGIEPRDRWLVTLSLHHMGGLAPVYRSTLYGTTIVLRNSFEPGRTADDIDNYDVTGVSLVPTMLERTLDRRGTLADSLRTVLLGGAPAPDELIERCRNFSIPVTPTYGMTETASQIATATANQARKRPGTVGRPLFGTDVTIVDASGEPTPPGESGEIVVDGPTVTPGYFEMPAVNRTSFGQYGLHTGDVGRVDDDGYLYVLNRLDDRIITGGENVEPGEVVAVLLDHPDVEDAAVVGLADDEWGERIGAVVVIDPNAVRSNPTGSSDAHTDTIDKTASDKTASDKTADGSMGTNEGVGSNESGTAEARATTDSDTVKNDEDQEPEVQDERGEEGSLEGSELDASTAEDSESDVNRSDQEPVDSSTVDAAADAHALGVIERDLIEHARTHLAGFKLPRTIAFTDVIPRTISGTVDREAMRTLLRDRGHQPGSGAALEAAGFEPADPEPPTARDVDERTEENGETESANSETDATTHVRDTNADAPADESAEELTKSDDGESP